MIPTGSVSNQEVTGEVLKPIITGGISPSLLTALNVTEYTYDEPSLTYDALVYYDNFYVEDPTVIAKMCKEVPNLRNQKQYITGSII